jgi:type I restriction enzyme R subunit
VRELGDSTLKKMAQELVMMLRKNTTIDWTIRESVQAKLRVYIKRLLKKYTIRQTSRKAPLEPCLSRQNF